MNQRKLPRWLPGLFAACLAGAVLLVWKPQPVTRILRGSFASVRVTVARKTAELEALLRRPGALAAENQALEAENAALLARLAWMEDRMGREELSRQARLLEEQYPDYRFLPVRVGGRDVTGGIWVIGEETLPCPAALTDENGCLIAEVVQASGKTALIQPITAAGFAAACWIGPEREVAMLSGEGSRCEAQELPRSCRAAVGDIIVTNGLGGVIPAGLTVGTVEGLAPAPDSGSTIAAVRPAAQLGAGPFYLMEALP